MENVVTTTEPEAVDPVEGFPKQLAIAVGLIAFADWLFYGHWVGISLALFILALAMAVMFCAPRQNTYRAYLVPGAFLLLALLPLVEDFGFLSVLIGLLGIACFTDALARDAMVPIKKRLLSSLRLWISGPVWCIKDLLRIGKAFLHKERKISYADKGMKWIVPLILLGVFTALFASANPLIGNWLSYIDPWALLNLVSFIRLTFWLFIAFAIWPFIFVRLPFKSEKKPREFIAIPKNSLSETIFGQASILRTVLLCNVLFAIQTITDIAYLWVGVALPDGMTYASYAHRGAYPLIVTALLAGGFVIAAMRPGSDAERSPAIRGLVTIWIGQNVMLVLSSALRLNSYVEVYSLTWWRMAAFIWMFLVAVGLVAIVARMALNKPNAWLVSTMLYALIGTLYFSSVADISYFIANYNVAHCRELSGKGTLLDVSYLTGLGPSAIPALDAYNSSVRPESKLAMANRKWLADELMRDKDNWRAWTFRGSRLRSYVDRPPDNADHT